MSDSALISKPNPQKPKDAKHGGELLPILSPTTVPDTICQKKFWTLRVLKRWPPRPPLSFSGFGKAFHAIMKGVYDPQDAPLPNMRDLDGLAKTAFWSTRYTDPAAREEDKARCIRMVRGYVEQDDELDALGTIAVEELGEFDFDRDGGILFRLSARPDRLIVRTDEPAHLYVRDYKTSRPKIDLEEAAISLWVAKLLYPDFKQYTMQFDWVDEGGRVDRDTIETCDVRGVLPRVMRRFLRILDSPDHPAEPGEACFFCALKPTCQPQQGQALDLSVDVFGED